MVRLLPWAALALAATASTQEPSPTPEWPDDASRTWVGPTLWANRLQDWRLERGQIVCDGLDLPLRTLHVLARRTVDRPGSFRAAVTVGRIGGPAPTPANAFAGFWIGAGAPDVDPRAAALVQMSGGADGGMLLGVDGAGRPVIRMMDGTAPAAAPAGVLPRDGWTVRRVDSAEPDQGGDQVLDGDPSTIWHTPFRDRRPPHPHEIVIDLGQRRTIAGVVYQPRIEPTPGRIESYELYVSDAATGDESWQRVATGELPDTPDSQTIRFAAVDCRAFRLVALSAHHGRPSTTIAELYALPAVAADATPAWDWARASLEATAAADGEHTSRVEVVVRDPATGAVRGRASLARVPDRVLAGNLALCCDRGTGPGIASFRFDGHAFAGSKLDELPDNTFGPIAGTQYTLSRGVLKLTAQLLPVGDDELADAVLEIDRGDGFAAIATARPLVPGYTAAFRVADWDGTRDVKYRVAFPLRLRDGTVRRHTWGGTIRAEPAVDAELVLAGFTGNHMVRHGFGQAGFPWNREGLWFPHDDLTAHVAAHDPDLLFFSGDQIYEGASPTRAEKRGGRVSELDYLYKWYLWVWSYRELTRDRPTITIPDDHDVYQGNVWGAGGRATRVDSEGGYVMPAAWVRMVDRTQTSHLPDPFDPTPIEQGIGVYYTSMKYGGVDLAILEDRKFKSGCFGAVPTTTSGRPDHVSDPAFDPRSADVPGAELLGARQEAFLDAWAGDWSDGTRMKVALSQTVFGGLATHHGANRQYLVADYDSNGWPQAGRNRALARLRKGFAFMLGGDQHLATLCWHGIDDWRDAGWSMAVPSVANFYPRAWLPPADGRDRPDGAPPWMGDHVDGFGNKVTIYAATNPRATGRTPTVLHDGMPGYGILRIDPRARTFVAECWPRASDPRQPGAQQYDGWPRTWSQREMDGRAPVAWLPPIQVDGAAEPVFSVFDSRGELVYALRATAAEFQPWVFAGGRYTVHIADPDRGLATVLTLDAAPARPETPVVVKW